MKIEKHIIIGKETRNIYSTVCVCVFSLTVDCRVRIKITRWVLGDHLVWSYQFTDEGMDYRDQMAPWPLGSMEMRPQGPSAPSAGLGLTFYLQLPGREPKEPQLFMKDILYITHLPCEVDKE